MELVYGLSDRQEINFVTSGLSQDGHFGISDSVVGTKYVFLKEAEKHPGIAGSFELKTPTGDPARGLGSGEFDYDLLLRAQKTWGRFTAIGNVGYTFVTDSKFGGVTTKFENTWFVASAQEFQLTKKNMLFSEIYLVSRETRSDPNLIAVNVGFERKLRDNLAVHAAIGKSVRGGPNLHAYVGLRLDFDAPWKQKE